MKVFVTSRIAQEALRPMLDRGWIVDMCDGDDRCAQDVLIERSRDADAIVVQGTDRIDRELMVAAAHLKTICCCSIGYDNVDLEAARERGIVVCNSPADDLIEATVEAAVALLLSVAKRITALHIAAGEKNLPPYSFVEPMGLAVRRKVTGIIGAGRIGGRIARTMKRGFDNSILYFNRSEKSVLEAELGARRCAIDELLSQSDFVFIAVPLTTETRHLVGVNELAHIKQDAIVVNVSRAGIMDDAALLTLLADKRIYGAGLDVYESIASECSHPNLVLTAHMANGEAMATNAIARLAIENVVNVLSGRAPLTPVQAETR